MRLLRLIETHPEIEPGDQQGSGISKDVRRSEWHPLITSIAGAIYRLEPASGQALKSLADDAEQSPDREVTTRAEPADHGGRGAVFMA